MSAHTPGPWEIDGFGDVTANGEDVARIATSDDCALDDARLISAAPELLEALIAVLPFAEDYCDSGPDGAGWKSDAQTGAISLARAAVAKATEATP